MRDFQLHQPCTVAEAVAILQAHGTTARPLAGGTDLVVGVMRDQVMGAGMPYPSHLVDLTSVPSLAGIRVGAEGAVIGATTTLAEIAASPEIRASWPLLAEAASLVASPEIQVLGTLGGNLHQRPRCWFFRNKDFDCIKKGGDVCFAVHGDNRYHAILGGHLCYIVHPSDMATALLALGASARVTSPRDERLVPFDEYFVNPKEDLLRETVLGPDELLTEVIVPPPPPGSRQAWQKLNEKGAPSWDFAVVSVAAAMTVCDGVWMNGRIVLGGVAPTPFRATVVEDALHGNDIRRSLPQAFAEFRKIARPMRDNAYKLSLAEVLMEQVLLSAVEEEQQPAGVPVGA